MNKYQKLVQQQFLNDEGVVIKRLQTVYTKSAQDIIDKIADLDKSIAQLQRAYADVGADGIGDIAAVVLGLKENKKASKKAGHKVYKMTPAEAKTSLKSMIQSKVYQKKYQEALQKQINGVLDKMMLQQYDTVSGYLQDCYENGYIGALFDLHGQGIPLIMPIDQAAMVTAVQMNSKIKGGMYAHLGENVSLLKKRITAEISRGISSGMSYHQVARNISAQMMGTYENPGGSMAYAMRIARTEGHRIQVESTMNAAYDAKDMGADVVKQWDAALDARTRESHQKVDGEVRELDEKFSNGLRFPGDPLGGAGEVVNCRCALLQRARWALDDDELQTLQDRAAFYGLDKAATFDEFKAKYIDAAAQAAQPQKKTYLTKKKLTQLISDLEAKQKLLPQGGDEWQQLEDLKSDYQEKLDKKLVAEKVKKLKKAQVDLQDQIDQMESSLKTYSFPGNSGKWANVSAKDYENLKFDIAKKKKYFEKQFMSANDVDDMKKFKYYIQQLDELEADGIKLAKLKADLQQTKKQISAAVNGAKKTTFGNDIIANAKTFSSTADAVAYHTQHNYSDDLWRKVFTADDREGVKRYTSSFYREMNGDLRSGKYLTSRLKWDIDNCTSALSKCSIAEDVVVYRGMGSQRSVARFLGVPESSLTDQVVRDSLIGTRATEKGFLSSAIVPGSAWSGCKLDLYLPKGTQAMFVDPVSTHSGELEVLIQRNSTFEVKEIITDSYGTVTKMVLVLVEQIL